MFAAMMAGVFTGGFGDRGLSATQASSGPLRVGDSRCTSEHNTRLLGGVHLREKKIMVWSGQVSLRVRHGAQNTSFDGSLRSAPSALNLVRGKI